MDYQNIFQLQQKRGLTLAQAVQADQDGIQADDIKAVDILLQQLDVEETAQRDQAEWEQECGHEPSWLLHSDAQADFDDRVALYANEI